VTVPDFENDGPSLNSENLKIEEKKTDNLSFQNNLNVDKFLKEEKKFEEKKILLVEDDIIPTTPISVENLNEFSPRAGVPNTSRQDLGYQEISEKMMVSEKLMTMEKESNGKIIASPSSDFLSKWTSAKMNTETNFFTSPRDENFPEYFQEKGEEYTQQIYFLTPENQTKNHFIQNFEDSSSDLQNIIKIKAKEQAVVRKIKIMYFPKCPRKNRGKIDKFWKNKFYQAKKIHGMQIKMKKKQILLFKELMN
jgi:hypothetical protein